MSRSKDCVPETILLLYASRSTRLTSHSKSRNQGKRNDFFSVYYRTILISAFSYRFNDPRLLFFAEVVKPL